jgi:hypothetical protein
MSQETSLTIVEQREVTFYDDELLAVRATDGQIYVSFRHLCDSLGINRQSQMKKIREHDVLAEGYKGGVLNTPPSLSGRGGGKQQTGLLRVDMIPMWLTTINPSRVRTDIREKIKQYQREAAKVLWEAFQDGRLTLDQDFDVLLEENTPEVQAYKMAMAVAKMARQQILLRSQLQDHEQRIGSIEAQLGDSLRYISAEQAMHVSQAVKTIALELGKISKRNEFPGVYGELYRQFKVPSYREVPASQYEEAMNFLRQWYETITDSSSIPF